MRSGPVRFARPLAFVLAFALVGTAAAPPLMAAGPGPLGRSAATRAARANLARAVAQDTPAAPSSNSSFLRSGKGVAVLALFVAGLGYAVYSRSEDRVKSQVR